MVLSLLGRSESKQKNCSDGPWLIYTDIHMRYQFRYPAVCTLTRVGENIHLQFDPDARGDAEAALPASPVQGCRFTIYKVRPFHDLIDLGEYLQFQDRFLGRPHAAHRSAITDLRPGYRGIREVRDMVDGRISSTIYISSQARLISILAVFRSGIDLDIELARSVRFF